LSDRILCCCHKRSPEVLDPIFDALPQNDQILSQQIIAAIVASSALTWIP
jgi:hypothetical protein